MTQTSLVDDGGQQLESKKDFLPSPSFLLPTQDSESKSIENSLTEPLLHPKSKKNDEEMLHPSVGHATHMTSAHTNMSTSISKRTKFVEVTAPMNMCGGSTFLAILEGNKNRVFEVTVPDGGVGEGQKFRVFYPKKFLNSTVIPPYGRWKDGIFDCFKLAFCHQSVWFTFLFPLLSISQLFRRINLTCCATKASATGSKSTTRVLICYTLSIIVWYIFGFLYGFHYKLFRKDWFLAIFLSPLVLLVIYLMFLTARARYIVRQRYNIPSKICGKKQSANQCVGVSEDTFCGICCTHCTICQTLRHTADYESYPAKVWRKDGLPRGTPIV